MNQNPNKKIYGLIGYPLAHSLSYKMHNAVFKKLNIPAEYKNFQLKPQELKGFLEGLDKENISGFNVTVPYKEKILKYVSLGQESFGVEKIGAVNTVIRKNNTLYGFNTDYAGFSRHLKETGFFSEGKSAAILGAGGAARAVCYALARNNIAEIDIFDIDEAKSNSIADMLSDTDYQAKVKAISSIAKLNIKEKDLLVNATPVGLKEDDPSLVSQELLGDNLFVYDLIYSATDGANTKLLKLAKEKGLKYSNGLGMLVYQGALAFKYFTNTEVVLGEIVGIMRKALIKGD